MIILINILMALGKIVDGLLHLVTLGFVSFPSIALHFATVLSRERYKLKKQGKKVNYPVRLFRDK